MNESVTAEAPSNIALIKYMGKHKANGAHSDVATGDAGGVTTGAAAGPMNSSLSYTLNHLRSAVCITPSATANFQDEWRPLEREGWSAPNLSDSAKERFLNHFRFLKSEFKIDGNFVVRSANSFPSDCGVASSASSFAALTMATFEFAKQVNPWLDVTRPQLAKLSSRGSGSSIRSFFEPFALWTASDGTFSECESWRCGFESLQHQAVIVDRNKKSVSSSDAHRRVETSLLFRGRVERAESRLQSLKDALGSLGNWRTAYEIVSAEFWDMHAMFHTSQSPFRYLTGETVTILDEVDKLWERTGDGPLVTLDAGPNAHLLYRSSQVDVARAFAEKIRSVLPSAQILTSYEKQI